jgi:hypothetical protein
MRGARRSAHRPSTRTARSSGTPGTEWSRRWWNRFTKTVLSLGALAGAITATLALLPSPDPEDSARFTAVHVTPLVPLSEYRQRSAALVPQGSKHNKGLQHDPGARAPVAELAWASTDKPPLPAGLLTALGRLQTDPTDSSPTDPATDTSALEPPSSEDTASSEETASSEDTASSEEATSETATSETSITEAPAPSDTSDVGALSPPASLVVPGTLQQEDFDAYIDEVRKRAEAQDICGASHESCADATAVEVVAIANSVDPEGNPVAPDVAAERVVKLLKDARKTGGKQSKGEPVGVVVSADLELVGLRGKPVMLSWSMWQQGGRKRLYGNWLNRNLAYRLKATTDHDTATLDLWIPLPKSSGPYFVRVALTTAGTRLAGADSPLFN